MSETPKVEHSATRTSDTAKSQDNQRDNSAEENRSQTSEQQSESDNGRDPSGQGAAAAAVANGKPAPMKEKPAEGNADHPAEAKVNRSGGRSAKLKGKAAHGNSPGDGGAAAATQTVAQDVKHAAGEQVTDTSSADGQSEPGAQGEGSPKRDGSPIELAPDSTSNSDSSAIAAAGAVAATRESQASAAENISSSNEVGPVEAIGAKQVENAEQAEPPNAGKRGRSAKAASVAEAIGSAGEPVVSSGEPAAPATAVESAAAVELMSTADAAAENEPVTADPVFSENNDRSEPRVGPSATAMAARNEPFPISAERSDGLTEAERVRFVQRVARAFHSMGDEGGEVRLRLSPPELGSLRLEVSVRDGVMSARLEAETASARNVLLENLPALRERLAEQNIKVERFDVDVRDQQRQAPGEQFAGQYDVPRQGQRGRTRGHEVNRPTAIAPGAPRAVLGRDNTGALNIVI
jgi:flagellar hook-length control protein FliK